jgi:hypothetical protein
MVGGVGSIMRLTVFAAAITFLLWGTPLFAQDWDADGVQDALDNCSEDVNSGQVDTDLDDCGNLCDADYDQTGVVGFLDLFKFGAEFGRGSPLFCHVPPIPGCLVGFSDWAFMYLSFGRPPGPSGTTAGTTACP